MSLQPVCDILQILHDPAQRNGHEGENDANVPLRDLPGERPAELTSATLLAIGTRPKNDRPVRLFRSLRKRELVADSEPTAPTQSGGAV